MKIDGFAGEKEILSFKLANGAGWSTTHRLIIQRETHNPRLNIMQRQDPEMYLLRDFKKAEIEGTTATKAELKKADTSTKPNLSSCATYDCERKAYPQPKKRKPRGNPLKILSEYKPTIITNALEMISAVLASQPFQDFVFDFVAERFKRFEQPLVQRCHENLFPSFVIELNNERN